MLKSTENRIIARAKEMMDHPTGSPFTTAVLVEPHEVAHEPHTGKERVGTMPPMARKMPGSQTCVQASEGKRHRRADRPTKFEGIRGADIIFPFVPAGGSRTYVEE